jgi:hypothetical protein
MSVALAYVTIGFCTAPVWFVRSCAQTAKENQQRERDQLAHMTPEQRAAWQERKARQREADEEWYARGKYGDRG